MHENYESKLGKLQNENYPFRHEWTQLQRLLTTNIHGLHQRLASFPQISTPLMDHTQTDTTT